MHDFTINSINPDRWALSFAEGIYRELIKAPTRKQSPLQIDWANADGIETDRNYNQYESRQLSLPVIIEGTSESVVLRNYNLFVNEVIIPGGDIVIGSLFLNRKFTLRYGSVSSIEWSDTFVYFVIELFDDYPNTVIPL